MQQLTIFDISDIEIIPRKGIIKNQVSILYKGHHIANARDCGKGLYEVRPKLLYFSKCDSAIRKMDKDQIEELSKRSFVDRYY